MSASVAPAADEIRLQRVVVALQDLPTLPSVVVRLSKILREPAVGAAEIARLIELDQSITAKVLSVVNSAFYGFERQISSIAEAVAVIGTRSLAQLVLGFGVMSAFGLRGRTSFDRPALWRHSVAVATLARELSRRAGGRQSADDVFTAGLLHDLGKVAVDYCCPDLFEEVLSQLRARAQPFWAAEQAVFGTGNDHALIGTWVARSWQLPLSAVVVIRHHHQPPAARSGFRLSADTVVDTVALANWLAHRGGYHGGSDLAEAPGSESTARIGQQAAADMDWVEGYREPIERACATLGVGS